MSDDQLRFFAETLDKHTGLLGEIKSSVEELKQVRCPSPGLCLDLQNRLGQVEIKAAKESGKREGFLVSGRIAYVVLGSGILTFGYQLWQIVQHKP